MINFRMLKLSDSWLWLATGLLVGLSFFLVFSATYRLQIRVDADPLFFIKRHFISLLVALAGLSFFCYLDYQRLRKAAPYLYGVMILLLVAIIISGSSAQGAQRWLSLGPLSFQPSEISKLILIMALASFFYKRKKIESLTDAGYLLALVFLPFLLIFKQPDLGTALVFIVILIGMLAASETSPLLLALLVTPVISLLLRPCLWLWFPYLAVLVIILFLIRASAWEWFLILGVNIGVGIALPLIWHALKAYQRLRIVAFLNPAADPFGAGYHTLQSKIAIGSGGLIGKGFLCGSQTQLQFIPEQHSDFIFSVLGEEFGFLGSLAVMAIFAVMIWRMVTLAAQASEPFGRMLVLGIAVMTAFHLLANIGMAVGILPVVGIPLPFLSYGGSSLFMNLAAVGIVQSVAMRRQKLIF